MRIRAKEIRRSRKREEERLQAKIKAARSLKPAAPARPARPARPAAPKAAAAPRPRAKAPASPAETSAE